MRSYQFQPPFGEIPMSATKGNQSRQADAAWFGRAVAISVAGSGALSLLSLMGRPVPTELPAWLQFLFPLDFAGISRTVTLVSSLALILVALHLWTLKARAWQIAQLMAVASVVFHLWPLPIRYGPIRYGWNLQEALSSAMICGALWLSRAGFVFGSKPPNVETAAAQAVDFR